MAAVLARLCACPGALRTERAPMRALAWAPPQRSCNGPAAGAQDIAERGWGLRCAGYFVTGGQDHNLFIDPNNTAEFNPRTGSAVLLNDQVRDCLANPNPTYRNQVCACKIPSTPPLCLASAHVSSFCRPARRLQDGWCRRSMAGALRVAGHPMAYHCMRCPAWTSGQHRPMIARWPAHAPTKSALIACEWHSAPEAPRRVSRGRRSLWSSAAPSRPTSLTSAPAAGAPGRPSARAAAAFRVITGLG